MEQITSKERQRLAYEMKASGYTTKEIAGTLGVEAKRIPTLAKAYMKRTGAEPWEGCRCKPVAYGEKAQETQIEAAEEPKAPYARPKLTDILGKLIADGRSNKEIGRAVREFYREGDR